MGKKDPINDSSARNTSLSPKRGVNDRSKSREKEKDYFGLDDGKGDSGFKASLKKESSDEDLFKRLNDKKEKSVKREDSDDDLFSRLSGKKSKSKFDKQDEDEQLVKKKELKPKKAEEVKQKEKSIFDTTSDEETDKRKSKSPVKNESPPLSS